jgi:hypothetical protein
MNNAEAREVANRARTARAAARATRLAPTIKEPQADGVTTLQGIAAALNAREVPTPWGRGSWQASQVRRLLARLG